MRGGPCQTSPRSSPNSCVIASGGKKLRPPRPERSFQKIVLQRQLSDLGMQRLHVDGWLRGSLAAGTEHIGCPFLELRLPRCDLIGVDVELLRKLSKRSIALQGRKRYPPL